MKCVLCPATVPDRDTAIARSWEPGAWSAAQNQEIGPVCTTCVGSKLTYDKSAGVFDVKPEFDK